MRFTTARLCGGKALMAMPAEEMDIDILSSATMLEKEGCQIKEKDEMMLVFVWNGMDVTLYSQGKVMYFPLNDKTACVKYASELLERMPVR